MEPENYREVDRQILHSLAPPGRRYLFTIFLLSLGTLVGVACWAYQVAVGLGVAGYVHPVY